MATQTPIKIEDTWIKVASGACYATKVQDAQIWVNIGLEAPEEATTAKHPFNPQDFGYSGSENVYMRLSPGNTSNVNVVVTVL